MKNAEEKLLSLHHDSCLTKQSHECYAFLHKWEMMMNFTNFDESFLTRGFSFQETFLEVLRKVIENIFVGRVVWKGALKNPFKIHVTVMKINRLFSKLTY